MVGVGRRESGVSPEPPPRSRDRALRSLAPTHETAGLFREASTSVRWLMVALDAPGPRGGIQRYLAELVARTPGVDVLAPEGRTGWAAVPGLAWRAHRRLAAGGYTGLIVAHLKLAAALPALLACHPLPAVVLAYGMEVTCGRFKALERWGLARASRVVPVSEYTGRLLVRIGVPADRVRCVTPGVALPAESPAEPHAPGLRLLSVGRLERSEGYKGHDRVLAALPALVARFPGLKWEVVGSGSALPDLARQVRDAGMGEHVLLRGSVAEDELARCYRRADVFVLPTRHLHDAAGDRFEGFGIVYLEAAAHGCPAVAGRDGGGAEAVADGETGLVVDADEPGALVAALGRLLADPELRRRMGEAARRRVAERFTWEHAARNLAGVLAEAAPCAC